MTRASSIRCRFSPRFEALEDRTLMSTCSVTRRADTDQGTGFRGTLRYCINKVNAEPGPDVIAIPVTGTINLEGVLPDLTTDIDIQGPGANLLTVRRNAGGTYRIFHVAFGTTVKLYGLTISNGAAITFGGGILNSGSLIIDSCTNAPKIGG